LRVLKRVPMRRDENWSSDKLKLFDLTVSSDKSENDGKRPF